MMRESLFCDPVQKSGYSFSEPHSSEYVYLFISPRFLQRSAFWEEPWDFTRRMLEKLRGGWPPELLLFACSAGWASSHFHLQLGLLYPSPRCLGQVPAQMIDSPCEDYSMADSAFTWTFLPQVLIDISGFARFSNCIHTIEWESKGNSK